MTTINNNLVPIIIGDNLNNIVLEYKAEQNNKILVNVKKHKKYFLNKIEEITNMELINIMEKSSLILTS